MLTLCMAVTMIPANTHGAVNGSDQSTSSNARLVNTEIDNAVRYQTRNDSDVRFIAYVDELSAYESVSFVLTINGKDSKELVCSTAYTGLLASGIVRTTEDIYGVDGYFVAYVVNGYISRYAGQEVTVNVIYKTKAGETYTDARTLTIGSADDVQKGQLTYANGYDWTNGASNIYAYASSNAIATPATLNGQSVGFMGWWYGVVLEYSEESSTWKVVVSDFTMDGTNQAESTTLGSNRIIISFHDTAATSHADSYNFFKQYAVVGAEFVLNGSYSTIQNTGALSGVYFTVAPPNGQTPIEPDDSGNTGGSGDSGSTDTPSGGNDGDEDSAMLTYANAYAWTDSDPLANHIYVYASATSTATAASINGQTFLGALYGIVLEYNSTSEKWKVVTTDFDPTDGVNAAESATLGSNRIAIIFHSNAQNGVPNSYSFLMNNATVGAEFYINKSITSLQGASGAIANTIISLTPIEDDTTTTEPEDPVIGTVSSTIATYNSTGSCTASSGDTDGLSAVLYAPSSATGISTFLNLGAVHTTLYTAPASLELQQMGSGIVTDKDIDNAYLYLCMNSDNWSGDYGVIKRLGDADWEIVTNDYYYSSWRWNAYSYPETSGVTVSYDDDYLYWKHNIVDGRAALYIKNSEYVDDLQMNMMISSGTMTFTIKIGGQTVFSVSDTASFSNIKLGRAASVTNSNSITYGSSNYLYQIASSLKGKTPTELTNVQFYDTYYYTSSGYNKLTLSAGSLWLYPNISSSAQGLRTNKNGDPIVTCQEVYLEDGRIMDIINIQNY